MLDKLKSIIPSWFLVFLPSKAVSAGTGSSLPPVGSGTLRILHLSLFQPLWDISGELGQPGLSAVVCVVT